MHEPPQPPPIHPRKPQKDWRDRPSELVYSMCAVGFMLMGVGECSASLYSLGVPGGGAWFACGFLIYGLRYLNRVIELLGRK